MPKHSIPILRFVDVAKIGQTVRKRHSRRAARSTQTAAENSSQAVRVCLEDNPLSSKRYDGRILCYQGAFCRVPRALRNSLAVLESVQEPPEPSTHVVDLSRFAADSEEPYHPPKKRHAFLANILGKTYDLRLGSHYAKPLKIKSYGSALVASGRQTHTISARNIAFTKDETPSIKLTDSLAHTPKPIAEGEWTSPEENKMHDATAWRDFRILTFTQRAAEQSYVETYGNFGKRAFAFAGVLLLLVLPIYGIALGNALHSAKGVVLGASEEGAAAVNEGVSHLTALQVPQAADAFAQAAESFYTADTVLRDTSGSLMEISRFLPGKGSAAASAHYLLTAGTTLSDVAATLASQETVWNTSLADNDSAKTLNPQTVGSLLLKSVRVLHNAEPQLQDAEKNLAQVDPNDLPTKVRDAYVHATTLLTTLIKQVNALDPYSAWLYDFLGYNGKRRYLVLFENDAELRATGGFMGSYALVDVLQGVAKVVEMPPQGTYAVQGQLIDFVDAPQPLQRINARWEFQDANWLPDFPATAKKAASFYERAGGPTVDGVIAFTPELGEQLLKILGPLDLTEQDGITVTPEIFRSVAQRTYQGMTKDVQAPKQILVDMVPAFFKKLADKNPRDLAIPFARTILTALRQKYLLLYYYYQSWLTSKIADCHRL